MTSRTIIRIAAWLLFGAIVVVTLGPVGLRPRTDFPVNVERLLAFLAMGLAFALAYPRHIWWAVAIVILGAVALEWLQEFRPDRHGRQLDALAKIAGATIGLGLGWLSSQMLRRNQQT